MELKFNDPIGIDVDSLSPAVRKVLSVGSTFTIRPRLSDTLHEANDRLSQMIEHFTNNRPLALQSIAQRVVTQHAIIMGQNYPENSSGVHATVQRGMREIRKNGWVLKTADKGLGLALIEPNAYEDLVQTHLTEPSFEKVPRGYPHNRVVAKVKLLMKIAPWSETRKQCAISYAEENSDPCAFYAIPKLHKPTLSSRPISASHSYALSDLSRQLASVLNDRVKRYSQLCLNSKEVVAELEHKHFPRNVAFLTYDVKAMYPSINIQDAVDTLSRFEQDIFVPNQQFWRRVLNTIMTENYVTFNGQTFRQLIGTATGTPVATAFANLYFYHRYGHVFRKYAKYILYSRHYVDDGLMVVRDDFPHESFMNDMNAVCDLEFTHELSQEFAIFLDLKILKGTRHHTAGKLDLEIYTKPMSKFLYLHGSSCHPRSIFIGIAKGELIRFLRNTTCEATWIDKGKFLRRMLVQRGYRRSWLRKAFNDIKFSQRASYLQPIEHASPALEPRLSIPYHPRLRPTWRALSIPYARLEQQWRIARLVLASKGVPDTLSRVYEQPPPDLLQMWPFNFRFTRGRTIGRSLIRARYNQMQRNDNQDPKPIVNFN